MSDFEKNLALGREAEIRVSGWLRGRGWLVLPTYDYSGKGEAKAPKLEASTPGESLVIPDLFAAQVGREPAWFEVKRKSHTDLYRKHGTRCTGISLRLWDHYRKVKAATGMAVWLIFVHEAEREVRGGEIGAIHVDPEYGGQRMGRRGMVFFDFDRLLRIASLDEVMGRAA